MLSNLSENERYVSFNNNNGILNDLLKAPREIKIQSDQCMLASMKSYAPTIFTDYYEPPFWKKALNVASKVAKAYVKAGVDSGLVQMP